MATPASTAETFLNPGRRLAAAAWPNGELALAFTLH
jgi:hypothetical protein